ncbi:MAG: hypothetical protein GY884_25530 [Proteobacteria bacterium]|nr:hypothetical protein [Pseudomonadota bacterium]
MRKAIAAIGVLVAAAIALILFTGQVDDEEQIRRLIEDVATAAEEGDIAGVMDPVAEDYEDSSGLEQRTLRGLLMREFLRGRTLAAVVGPINVELIDDEHAHARFETWLAEDATGSIWPERTDSIHFEVDLEKRDGDWMIVYTEHESIF